MSRYKPYPQYKDSGIEWLGQVPEHWSLSRIKHIATVSNSGSYGEDDFSTLTPFTRRTCTTAQITIDGRFLLDEMPERFFDESDIIRYQGELGDLFVVKSSGSNTNIISGKLARISDPYVGIIFTNFLMRIRPNIDKVLPSFLECFLGSWITRRRIERMVATTTYPNINVEEYVSAFIVLPPINEQAAIVNYLDRETTRIDTLIEKKSRFIELLQEKRQALITQAVTKGLDPNANLKDSGVKWLGQVPEHWTVCHLQYVIINIEQGWSPECHSYPAEPGQWGILKSGCVNGGVYNNNENKALPEELSPKPQYEVKAGDILMSRASGSPELIGSVALVANTQDKLMLSDKIFRIQCAVKMNPAFFVNMLNSSALRSQIMHAISGAEGLANNLPQAHIKKFWVTCPPLSEQQTIVSILDQNIARIDALITATQRSMELLKERRAALITAAVTGQIDLRDSATGEGEIL